jgi:hypothetical protein
VELKHSDMVHRVVDETRGLASFDEVFSTPKRATVQPHICIDGKAVCMLGQCYQFVQVDTHVFPLKSAMFPGTCASLRSGNRPEMPMAARVVDLHPDSRNVL